MQRILFITSKAQTPTQKDKTTMHIAYITETYPPELNGVSLTVARSIRYLCEQGHEVELIRPRQPQEAPRDAKEEYLTPGLAIPMYRDLRMGLPVTKRLQSRWSRRRPQLVHVATEGPLGWAASRAARLLGIPVTSDFRTNFHEYSRYYGLGWAEPAVRAYLRHFHNCTDLTFVPTRAVQRNLLEAGFERVEVVGRGVDAQLFDSARRSNTLRARWGATGETPVLLYVGRLAAEKNISQVFLAYKAARHCDPSTRLVVVGDGPLSEDLRNLYPNAYFAGVQRGVALAECYASADIFLFPSLTDTFGNVVLEAMASGLAVLAYDNGAAAEHIVDCASGVLVTPGNTERFINDTCMLVQQFQLLSTMRRHARAMAQRAHWNGVLGDFERRLCVVAQQHGVRHAQPSPI